MRCATCRGTGENVMSRVSEDRRTVTCRMCDGKGIDHAPSCSEAASGCQTPHDSAKAAVIGDGQSAATDHGPTYYRETGVQPWDAMAAWMPREQFIGFLRGNAIKYLARAGRKGTAADARRDYEKAQHYQQKLLEVLETPPCDE